MNTRILASGCLVIGAVGVLSAQAPAALKVETLASPAGANSSVPQMTVTGDRVVLSWVEREGTKSSLKFAERSASGWSPATTVISSDKLMVNSADVPSVRATADGYAAHWMMESGPDPEAYDLRVAFSGDGKSWTMPKAPNTDKTMSQHGFATLFPLQGGTGVVWLDGRTTHGDEGDMQLRFASFDRANRFQSDTLVDSRVCECCSTSVAVTAEGPIVAYRDRSAGDIRDIYVARYAGAGKWSAPVRVHADNFKIDACPINGPAIDASGKDVVVAWFTAPNEKEQSYVAFSRDGGRIFGKAIKVEDSGTLGRMQVALSGDGNAAIVGWIEFANEKSTFKVRRIGADGTRGPSVSIADISGTRFPRLAGTKNEAVVAWTASEGNSSRVKTARISLR